MTKRVVFGLLVALLGGVLAFGGARVLYRARASEHWPQVQGTVRASSVETQRSKRSATFVPHVRYDYAVGAEHYTSETLSFTRTASGDSGEAREQVRPYPVGASVTVHYSPDEPQLACLECGRVGVADYGVLVAGLVMTVFAAWGLLETLSSHRASLRRQQRRARTASPGEARLD
jgi:hypothetical protein